jgi:hypothetical protein
MNTTTTTPCYDTRHLRNLQYRATEALHEIKGASTDGTKIGDAFERQFEQVAEYIGALEKQVQRLEQGAVRA